VALASTAVALATIAIFYVLPLPPALRLSRAANLPSWTAPILALTLTALVSYVSFWCWFVDPQLGRAFTVIALLSGVALAVRFRALLTPDPDLITPIGAVVVLSLLYTAILAFNCIGPLQTLPNDRFGLPGDNGLPQLFAEKIAMGDDPRVLIPEWLSSDRPPVQTGMLLFLRPVFPPDVWSDFGSTVIGLVIQLGWVPAVWMLLRGSGLTVSRTAVATCLIAASGFVYVNSIFTWPKLIAAALALFAVSLVRTSYVERRPLNTIELGIAIVAGALGFLCHAGVAFTLIPLGIFMIARRWRPSCTHVLRLVAVAALLITPWTLYQQVYDPPGDRLLKWHIGGDAKFDPLSFGEALRLDYQAAGVGGTIENKIGNVKTVLPIFSSWASWFPLSSASAAESVSDQFVFCNSVGFTSVGLVLWLASRMRMGRFPPLSRSVAFLGGILLSSVLVWCAILFGPADTISHQGSYANNLILLALAALATVVASRLGSFIVLGYGIVCFALTFVVFGGDQTGYNGDAVALLCAAIALAIMLALAIHRASRPGRVA
jgi:hypothetical protein